MIKIIKLVLIAISTIILSGHMWQSGIAADERITVMQFIDDNPILGSAGLFFILLVLVVLFISEIISFYKMIRKVH